jgi:glycosyltransferase involved in cell wall biosynthesis
MQQLPLDALGNASPKAQIRRLVPSVRLARTFMRRIADDCDALGSEQVIAWRHHAWQLFRSFYRSLGSPLHMAHKFHTGGRSTTERSVGGFQRKLDIPSTPARRRCIAIDMTPMLTGGANGGVKLLAKTLIERFGQLQSDWDFVLLTSRNSHDELLRMETHNVRCVCIREDRPLIAPQATAPQAEVAAPRSSLGNRLKHRVVNLLPQGVDRLLRAANQRLRFRNRLLKSLYGRYRLQQALAAALPGVRPELLFCPFTAPLTGWPNSRPIVSLIVDLQHRYHGEFFTTQDRNRRESTFLEAARRSRRIVCISNYTRQTVVDTGKCDPARVDTVYIGMSQRLPDVAASERQTNLARLGLVAGRYLIYPANCWQHKNHLMLLTAFAQYLARHPHGLQLVLTGADTGGGALLREAIDGLGIASHVKVTGYLSDAEISSLMRDCAALIFPSLFEGFGIPTVEAMALGKIVLCSNTTSLPEIVGDAAILFDPRRPIDIVSAIERFEQATPARREQLIATGHERVRHFGGLDKMAQQYLRIFGQTLEENGSSNDGPIPQRSVVSRVRGRKQRKVPPAFHTLGSAER